MKNKRWFVAATRRAAMFSRRNPLQYEAGMSLPSPFAAQREA